MTTPNRLRLALKGTTALAAALMFAVPALAQSVPSIPDTGNVTVSTRGLGGAVPGSTNPTFTPTPTQTGTDLRVDLRDNRTILNWGGNGFNIAQGSSVNFKDARATAGVTNRVDNIAVLNRDLSGRQSNIMGSLKSDANVGVYVINTNGVLMGGSSTVNTGAFFASAMNITDDNDFLNGNTSLRFAVGGTGGVWANGSITTATDSGGSGGRMGDVVILSPMTSIANLRVRAGGDVAIVHGSDVKIQNSPGSPLSIIISRGGVVDNNNYMRGAIDVTGRNVTIAAAFLTQGSGNRPAVSLTGKINATGALATDRGIVLTAGGEAPGVQLSPVGQGAISDIGFFAIGQYQGPSDQILVTSSTDIAVASGKSDGSQVLVQGQMTAARNFLSAKSTAVEIQYNGNITAGEIALLGSTSLDGALKSTFGDINFGVGAVYSRGFGNATLSSARDILIGALGVTSRNFKEISSNRDIIISGQVLDFGDTKITAGRSIELKSEGSRGYIQSTGKITAVDGGVSISALNSVGIYYLESGQDLSVDASAVSGFEWRAGGSVDVETHGSPGIGSGSINVNRLFSGDKYDVILKSTGDTQVGAVVAGRDIVIRAVGTMSISCCNVSVTAGRNIDVSASAVAMGKVEARTGFVSLLATNGSANASQGVKSFGDLTVRGTSIWVRNADVATGDIRLESTSGNITLASSQAGGDVYVGATRGSVKLAGNVISGGNLSVMGDGIELTFDGESGSFDWTHKAAGSVMIDARTGDVKVSPYGSIQSNSDGLGDESLTVQTSGMIDIWSSDLIAGLDRESNIYLRYGADTPLMLGGLYARRLYSAVGNGEYENGLRTTQSIGINGTVHLDDTFRVSGRSMFMDDVLIENGDIDIVTDGELAFGGAVNAAGSIKIRSNFGSLSIRSRAKFISGGEVILSAGGALINERGSDLIYTPNGRWLIYLAAPSGNTFGGFDSGNTAIWGSTLASRAPSTISGNRYVFAETADLTFTPTAIGKVYGTDLTGSPLLYTVSGFRPGVEGAYLGDTVATAFAGSPLVTSNGLIARASVAGSPYSTSLSLGSLVSDAGYSFVFDNSTLGSITVTPKALTLGYVADSKTYDGTTDASGTVTVDGVVLGDTVVATGAVWRFLDKNAGTGKTVSVTGTTLTGTDAGNYSFVLPTGTTIADIYRKSLTAAITAASKTYDGTTAATGTLTLAGLVQGDSVGTAGTVFSFADKNAGTGKTVTATGTTLTGTDAGNYELGTVGTATADIFRKAITGSIAALDKTYDGLVQTNGSVTLSGVIVGDAVGTDGSVWTFADKNAGVGKTVTVNGTRLSGEDAGNYTLTLNGTTTTATIFKRQVGATVTADSKVYDGTTTATGTIDLYDFVEGDQLGTTGTVWSFDDKNAGARKTVRLSGTTLTGADAGNYSLDLAPTTVASISRKALNMVVQVNGKTYDGTTAATGTATLDGVIAGETVGLTGMTLTFADKNAGTGKAVTVSGAMLTGTDSGNYTLALPTNALGDIFRKAVTGSVQVNGKTYDGTTAATGSVSLNGVVQGDQLGTAGTLYSFADKNAGTGKTVTISGTTLIGADAGNYTLTLPASAVADILKRGLTGTIAANDKVYDGTTAGSGTITLDNVVVGDAVGTTGSVWTFDSKNAGTGKTVTLSGTTLTGDDAANYTLTLPATALADIMRKALTGTVTADSRTYDGTTSATGSVSLNGVVQGDQVGTAGSIWRFADKNAGTGKTVTLSGTVLNGTDAGNYTLTLPGTALADILKRSLVVTPTVAGKVYDGTTGATGTVSVSGAVQGDDVGVTGTGFAFADKNAGTGKTVNVTGTSLTGADSANYALSIPTTVLGDIFRKAITGTVAANGKTYDGTTTGSGTVTLDGVLQGDQVGTTGTVWTFADKNAGTGKVVTISGTTLNGVDGGNYTVTLPASAFADILKKAITGTVTVTSRQYDGTTDASGSVALNGVVQGDQVGTTGTVLRFADANAGTGKAVSVSGTALNGADAGNYTLTMPAAAVGDILKRAVSVAANDASKIRDEEDPLLTFTLVSGTLVAGDLFSGDLTRAPGERPGRYAISIGSLSLGGNYEITFTPGTFTINLDPASDLLPPTLRALFLPSQIQADPNGGGAKITIDRDALCGEDTSCTVH